MTNLLSVLASPGYFDSPGGGWIQAVDKLSGPVLIAQGRGKLPERFRRLSGDKELK